MTNFITDSIKVRKKYTDFIFTNELYRWTLKENSEGYIDTARRYIAKKKLFSEKIKGIVSPTNYKLIYDILQVDKNAKFYKPEDFAFGKRVELNIDKNKINQLFENSLKRSYLSFLNYDHLRNIGLKRVEQYILMLSTVSLGNSFISDNLFHKEDISIDKITTLKIIKVNTKKVKLLNFIYVLNKKYNYSFDDISSFLFKAYSELKITDPFNESGFIFLEEEDSDIYETYKEIVNKEIEVQVKELTYKTKKGQDKKIIIRQSKASEEINNYYMLQSEEYFEQKQLVCNLEYPNIMLLEPILSHIMPLKDLVLTLKILLKLGKIQSNRMVLSIEEELKKKLKPKQNAAWLNKSIWKEIYENKDYLFSNTIDPITTEYIEFSCPVCGDGRYKPTPQKIFCGYRGCRFKFNRINLKSFGIPKISVDQTLEALANKSLMIKKSDGKNLVLFLNNKEDYYYLYID